MIDDPTHIAEVAGAYDRWSKTYDSDPNKTRELAALALRSANLHLTGQRVVEVGCGTGFNTHWLAAQAVSVVAFDFSAGMLQQARARVREAHVQFIEQDIRVAWPMRDSNVDLVIIMLVLEHVENLDPILIEAARVLRPGGEIFLCELHPIRQLLGSQAQFTDTNTGELVFVTAYQHDVSEFVNAALLAGFEMLHLGEPRDPNALSSEPPRLLTLHLRLRAQS